MVYSGFVGKDRYSPMSAESVQKAAEPIEEVGRVEKAERERSRIEFPYYSLDEATKIAKGIFDLGANCQIDQLAGHLNQSATGGGFRVKLMTARTFGLITYTQGNAALTDLGSQIVDADGEREARALAFLKVPLYNAIYEQFKGKTIPGNIGLEGAMVNLGVATKQKDKARQAFQRSAKEAGFFAYGATKLVYPVIGGAAVPPKVKELEEHTPEHKGQGGNGGSGGGGGDDLHPFIKGLLDKLPAADSTWPVESRKKWLQTASNIFDLMYKSSPEDSGEIEIQVNKDSAK